MIADHIRKVEMESSSCLFEDSGSLPTAIKQPIQNSIIEVDLESTSSDSSDIEEVNISQEVYNAIGVQRLEDRRLTQDVCTFLEEYERRNGVICDNSNISSPEFSQLFPSLEEAKAEEEKVSKFVDRPSLDLQEDERKGKAYDDELNEHLSDLLRNDDNDDDDDGMMMMMG